MTRQHSGEHMPRDQYVRHHVDFPYSLPVFVRSFGTSADGNACVGAHDVDPSVGGFGLRDHGTHRRLIGDITCDRRAVDLASNGLGAMTIDVSHHHTCSPSASKPSRERSTDAASGASDDYDPAVYLHRG